MAEIGVAFRRPFAEQLAALRLRLQNQLPTEAWDDLRGEEHNRSFVVSGAVKADLLADIADAIVKAEVKGTTLDDFRRDFRKIVETRGWTGWTGEGSKKGEAWRTRVIYQTNIATSYAAGRHAQLIAGKYPIWIYRHSGNRHPRLNHLAWDKVALPVDHPFWVTHYPPNGWFCGCTVEGARSRAGVVRMGGDPDKTLPEGWDRRDKATGAPVGIDKGWDYAPGASVSDLIAEMARKAGTFPEPLAQDFRDHLAMRPPGPGRAPMIHRNLEPTTDLDAISAMAKEARMTIKTGHQGVDAEGYFDMVRTGIEAVERFELPPVRYFGVSEEYPYTKPAAESEFAVFHVAMRSVSFPASTTERAFVLSKMLREPSSVAQADWQHRLAGVSAEVRARTDGGYPGWSICKSPADIAAHEFGHYFHENSLSEIDALIGQHKLFEDGWAYLLSDYATADRFEFLAEAFALYLRYTSEHHRLHPALLEYLRRRDRSLK